MLEWEYNQDAEFKALREEGEEKVKAETAIEMLRDGFSADKVAQYVKMPTKWVEELMRPN